MIVKGGVSMTTHILLLEDDPFLRDGITELLTREGYRVTAAETVRQAETYLSLGAFALAVFDVLLPDGSGLALCRRMRERGVAIPILCLTACDEESDIVAGLDAGADDYVTKPFRTQVLLARVRALLRRSETKTFEDGDLFVDFDGMLVRRSGKPVYLTPTEFQILRCLLQNSGVIVTRDTLLRRIWDDGGNFIDDNTLSVHISRLREKIGAFHIVTVRGVGYRWEEAQHG